MGRRAPRRPRSVLVSAGGPSVRVPVERAPRRRKPPTAAQEIARSKRALRAYLRALGERLHDVERQAIEEWFAENGPFPVKIRLGPPPPDGPHTLNEHELYPYLLDLQRAHRPAGGPIPSDPAGVAHETHAGIFNATAIVHILVGHAGPWTADSAQRLNLVFTLNQLEKRRELRELLRRSHADAMKRQRAVRSLMSRVQGFWFQGTYPDISGRQRRALILGELAAELAALRGAEPPVPGRMRPPKPWSSREQRTWLAPLALALCQYLGRTLPPAPRRPERVDIGRREFAICARILSIVAGERITPDMVKDRYERASGGK